MFSFYIILKRTIYKTKRVVGTIRQNINKKIILASFSLFGLGALAQAQDPVVPITGAVRDTSGASIEYADVNVVLKDDLGTAQDAITDFFGEYNIDMSTDVEDVPIIDKTFRVIGNGTAHVGVTGYVNTPPVANIVNIIDRIGRTVGQVPLNYNPANGRITYEFSKNQVPVGIYFGRVTLDNQNVVTKIMITDRDEGAPGFGAFQTTQEINTTQKSAIMSTDDPLKYYITISPNENTLIQFDVLNDSLEAIAGNHYYPEHTVMPIIPDYEATVEGIIRIGDNLAGENFKITIDPEVGNQQILYTDENSEY